jgi:hypothetical protein
MQSDNEVHTFNNDLVANAADLDTVRKLYKPLEHALFHPELIEWFNTFNDRANAAKKGSRKWGERAIALGALALFLASGEIITMLLTGSHWSLAIGALAAVCGLASVAIGAFGVLFGERKTQWLHNRFMGERIRQFHFQSLIVLLPHVLASARPGADKSVFESERQRLFAQFRADFEGKIDSQFSRVIGAYGGKQYWLPEPQDAVPVEDSPEFQVFCKAYFHLRIQHQLAYADYKLQPDHKIYSNMPVQQAKVLESVSKAGLAWLLIIHGFVFAMVLFTAIVGLYELAGATSSPPFGISIGAAASAISIAFSLAIIVIAIVALSARAYQEGLQPEREIERYQQYRSAVQSILEQFQEADSPRRKLAVVRRMERVAFDEMRNFLITMHRSSFAL